MPSAMLHVDGLTLRIGGRLLLDQASVRLPAGQRIGLVGANGSGKTSLLRLILGEVGPDAGEVRLRRSARVGWVAHEAPGGARFRKKGERASGRRQAQGRS
jgi:ATP-binding cassette subfamily F protein 3